MNNFRILLLLSGFALLSAQAGGALAAVAGHVQFVHGVVQVTTPGGQVRTVQKGDALNEGDTLTSAAKASAQIRMQDGGFIAVRPDTRMKFDQFRFSGKEDGEEKSFFSLFKGGFRAVTGLIGRINKQNYKITTPAATIGIRGTDHETFLVTPDSPLAQFAPSGAYSKVNTGETTLTTDKGTINVQPNQMGFAGGMNQVPQLQPLNTNIFTVAAAPAEEARLEQKEETQETQETQQDQQQAESTSESTGTAESGTAQTEGAPEDTVRDTAVVDAAAPATGAMPAADAPVVDGAAAGAAVFVPEATVAPPVVVPVNGQTVNLNTQIVTTTATGQTTTITAATTTTPTYAASNGYGYEVLGVDGAGNWLNPFATNLPAASYLLDAGKNLVGVVGRDKFSGGVAKDTFVSADGSVYFGRWQGGTYADLITPASYALGNTSMQWVFSANPPLDYVQTLAGTTSYSLTAATHPTDALGNVGTLNSATLSADFTNQIVNISLALSFSTANPNFVSAQNKAFTVTTPNGIAIFGDTIWGLGAVACTGANCDSAAGYTADIWARFAGNAADKVAIPYNIVGNLSDVVQGVAMVTAATAPVVIPQVAPAPYVQTDLAVALATSTTNYLQPYVEVNTFIAKPADINNTLPNPALLDRYAGKDVNSSVTYILNGTTIVGEAPTTLANGIQFGRYDTTSAQKVVVGTTNCCTAGTYTSPGAVYSHWIAGPAVSPVYLPEVLGSSATYSLAGGTTPTTTTGMGTLLKSVSSSGTPSSLSVNFAQQLVAFNLALTVGADEWVVSTAGAPLVSMYWSGAKVGFRATTMARPDWAPLAVTINQSGGGVFVGSGDVTGQLTGNALEGALLSYVLSNGSIEQVAGVAAFSGTPQIATIPYRIAALSTIGQIPAGQTNAGAVVPLTMGGYNNAGNVLFDAAGNAIQFHADKPFSNGGAISINKGTATLAGLGTDPVSGISWGRWQGGALTSTDLVNNATGTIPNNNNTSSHWITGPVMTGPVTLPVSGTYNYVLAGGTAPTDSLGGVGTLNSATLSANFTAQTVNIGVNVTTPNVGNLAASAVNVPIEQKNFFGASTANALNGGSNAGLLTVTCPAGCAGSTLSGDVGGVFTGPGAIGAGMVYGLQKDAVIVNGVAAFHR